MADAFDQWGVVEIMGRQTYAGHITETVIAGGAFVRVDVPEIGDTAAFTKLFGAASIYCITPTTEQVARSVAAQEYRTPVYVYDTPAPRRIEAESQE